MWNEAASGRLVPGRKDVAVGGIEPQSRWQASAFLAAGSSSFSDLLSMAAPELLPGAGHGATATAGVGPQDLPHGTTIVAAVCEGGVVMAGDRRATAGNMIAQRDIEKVFRGDEFTAVGIAGVAGIGVDLIRLFQVELEHYEGLVAVPLLAGYDEETDYGRIFSYDVAGGRYEEQRFASIGSGSVFARGSLKKLYRDGMPSEDVVLACMQALYDAADDDSATGGPDLTRRIYPSVATVTADGFVRLSDEEAGRYAQAIVTERLQVPDGPLAPMDHIRS
jgi:proteasome beta subunit